MQLLKDIPPWCQKLSFCPEKRISLIAQDHLQPSVQPILMVMMMMMMMMMMSDDDDDDDDSPVV